MCEQQHLCIYNPGKHAKISLNAAHQPDTTTGHAMTCDSMLCRLFDEQMGMKAIPIRYTVMIAVSADLAQPIQH